MSLSSNAVEGLSCDLEARFFSMPVRLGLLYTAKGWVGHEQEQVVILLGRAADAARGKIG